MGSRRNQEILQKCQSHPQISQPFQTRRNFPITKKPSESMLKTGVRTAANIASAVGTVGGLFFALVGAIGFVISSFLD